MEKSHWIIFICFLCLFRHHPFLLTSRVNFTKWINKSKRRNYTEKICNINTIPLFRLNSVNNSSDSSPKYRHSFFSLMWLKKNNLFLRHILVIHRTLIGTTTPNQSGPRSNSHKEMIIYFTESLRTLFVLETVLDLVLSLTLQSQMLSIIIHLIFPASAVWSL